MQYNSNKISSAGDLIVTSQEHRYAKHVSPCNVATHNRLFTFFRTQPQNREDCLKKLRHMISEASVEPKDRKMYEGLSDQGKARRVNDKKKRGQVKETRRTKIDYD
jgi:hypothetical protein